MHSHTIKDPPPNFLVPFTSLSLKFSPGFFHTHFLPSDPKSVDFGFIRPHHLLPILHSPMLVCQSKVHPLLPMFFGKEGLFLFHHSFHPNYFKAVTHSLSMERLVGDVRESLGHIHSSISLSRTDKTLCKTNVGCRKLGRMTTRRLREMRAMFRTKPRDGSNAIASGSCNFFGRITCIKQRQDVVLTCR